MVFVEKLAARCDHAQRGGQTSNAEEQRCRTVMLRDSVTLCVEASMVSRSEEWDLECGQRKRLGINWGVCGQVDAGGL